MAKTRKVMDIEFHKKYYVCIEDSSAAFNPYKLYEKWYDRGWHRKKITEYTDMDSVLFHLLQIEHKKVQWDVR